MHGRIDMTVVVLGLSQRLSRHEGRSFMQRRVYSQSSAAAQDGWFVVRGFGRRQSLFGSLAPPNHFRDLESRSLLRKMLKSSQWAGNNPNLPSSPAAVTYAAAMQPGTATATGAGAGGQLLPSEGLFPPKLLIQCLSNNIHIVLSGARGQTLAKWSSGVAGFKGTQKTTSRAALGLMDLVFAKFASLSISKIRVDFRGLNPARQVLLSQLRRNGLQITEICDSTPVPFGGPRPKKARRL